MSEFVRHHTGDFLRAQACAEAGRGGNARVFGITAGGGGILLVILDDIYLRYRQLGIYRQLLNDPIISRCRTAVYFLCGVHSQDNFFGIPIGEPIQRDGNQQGDDHPAFAADQEAIEKEDAGHPCDRYAGVEHIRRRVVPWC